MGVGVGVGSRVVGGGGTCWPEGSCILWLSPAQ